MRLGADEKDRKTISVAVHNLPTQEPAIVVRYRGKTHHGTEVQIEGPSVLRQRGISARIYTHSAVTLET